MEHPTYTEQLELWEKATGIKRIELLSIGTYFNFTNDRNSQRWETDTWTKTLKNKPSRREGKYNLYRILGTFYACEVVSQSDIQNFLHKHYIREIPDGRSWEEIWNCMEAGAQRAKPDIKSKQIATKNFNIPPSLPNENASKKMYFSKKTLALLLSSFLLLFVFGLIAYFLSEVSTKPTQSTDQAIVPSAASFPCVASVPAATPVFLPDQGFSQYQSLINTPESSLLDNAIRTIGINGQGVWVGYAASNTPMRAVSYYDKQTDRWFHCNGLNLRPHQTINSFAFKDNAVYIAIDATNDYPNDPGVAELTQNGWHFFYANDKDRLPSNIVYSVIVDKNGTVWATTYEGVARLVDDTWELVHSIKPGELPCNDVSQFADDNQNNRWFALIKCGITELINDIKWNNYYTDDAGLKNARAIAIDNRNTVWVATDGGGLVKFDSQKQTVFKTPQLPSNNVQDVEIDQFGRIWVATASGVSYTPDNGQTWVIHSTLPALGIKFGCSNCAYDENHLWLVLKGQGIGHVRIPPVQLTLTFTSLPPLVQLHPGEKYVFNVEVEIQAEGLHKSDGDSLRSSDPIGTNLYGAYPIIPMYQDEVTVGQKYTFSNVNDPIIAPNTPGKYQLHWRVWQGRRFVTDPITIEFEVIPN